MAGDFLAKLGSFVEYFLRRGHGRTSLITMGSNGC
jgi:hypothetical protein